MAHVARTINGTATRATKCAACSTPRREWSGSTSADGPTMPELIAQSLAVFGRKDGDEVGQIVEDVRASYAAKYGTATDAPWDDLFAAATKTARQDGATAMRLALSEHLIGLRVTVGALGDPDATIEDEIHDLWLTIDRIEALDPVTVAAEPAS